MKNEKKTHNLRHILVYTYTFTNFFFLYTTFYSIILYSFDLVARSTAIVVGVAIDFDFSFIFIYIFNHVALNHIVIECYINYLLMSHSMGLLDLRKQSTIVVCTLCAQRRCYFSDH